MEKSKSEVLTFPRKEKAVKEEYKRQIKSIYTRTLVSKKVSVEMNQIGEAIKDTLEGIIKKTYEGKCSIEGFIKPGSSKLISYSSGTVKGMFVLFEVVFECQTLFPVEGQLLQCVAKNITKAGIRGESVNETPSPFVVFVARDHQVDDPLFASVKEDDVFVARIIGQRFELNDEYISVIAELVNKTKYKG
jgi:DNA-directed RNA polymerase subunit E'/Rpb7